MKPVKTFLFSSVEEIVFCIILIIIFFYYTSVEIWVYVLIIIIFTLVLLIKFYLFYPHFKKPVTGKEGMLGRSGVTIETLNPEGKIKVHGEIWNAISVNGIIDKGKKVEIIKVENLDLLVKNKN